MGTFGAFGGDSKLGNGSVYGGVHVIHLHPPIQEHFLAVVRWTNKALPR